MKILTAIGNPILKQELEKRGYEIVNKDIQYKEGILEYLEENKIDFIILYENLEGQIKFEKLIGSIKKQVRNIIVILESNNFYDYLKKEEIKYILKKDIKKIEDITYHIKKEKKIKKNFKLEKIKKYKKNNKTKENRNLKKIKLKKEKIVYKKKKNKKIIGIINLLKIENKKIEKFIKNKKVLKIFFYEKNKLKFLKMNNKEMPIGKNEKIIKFIIFFNLKNMEENLIYVFIENENILKQIKDLKHIDTFIWAIDTKEKFIKINKIILKQYYHLKSKIKLLFINNNWHGIDNSILKNIFSDYKIVKKIGG